MKRSTTIGTLWAAAAVGVCLGVAGFLAIPFESGSDAAAPTGPAPTSSKPPASSPPPTSPASPEASGPPFTRNALLLPAEFVRFGWGTAKQTAVYDKAGKDLGLLCLSGAAAAEGAAEEYAGTYRGLQTEAAEVVARYPDSAAAERALERLSRRVSACEPGGGALAARPGTRHEPRLSGVDRAIWWDTDANRTAPGARPDERGVIGLARVGDRLVALSLTSTSSDPATTVQWEPLLGQAARRLA
ncbi:hypothetical protein HUT18_14460 [Streptomyces sp. NA04227]|uniref:hypothetical protein n=1 Tax=Streptomyces sp. NA04227 TaxID=2742136 RepID=UPI001591A1DD|nr:hypothetical protein [Streptomyces sp. NA04227]QKW07409.1 hypothetical protein HUT18_14460 [Streptomyces sp. NA04227]